MKEVKISFKNSRDLTLKGILNYSSNTKDEVLVCLHGFERTSMERKFQALTEKVNKINLPSFRFDFTGCGMSNGDYSEMTITQMTDDLKRAIKTLSLNGFKKYSFFAHSLGACVLSNLLKEDSRFCKINKIILMAPALNQRDLLRYWFVQLQRPNTPWEEYESFFSEEKFEEYLKEETLLSNPVHLKYFEENKDKDYSCPFRGEEVLHIHGMRDKVVPYESVDISYFSITNQILQGDHDMETPRHLNMWTQTVAEFLRT